MKSTPDDLIQLLRPSCQSKSFRLLICVRRTVSWITGDHVDTLDRSFQEARLCLLQYPRYQEKE